MCLRGGDVEESPTASKAKGAKSRRVGTKELRKTMNQLSINMQSINMQQLLKELIMFVASKSQTTRFASKTIRLNQ